MRSGGSRGIHLLKPPGKRKKIFDDAVATGARSGNSEIPIGKSPGGNRRRDQAIAIKPAAFAKIANKIR